MPKQSASGELIHFATFSGDAQLLAELGERLIIDPIVAVAELVKNSYDADATQVYLWLGPEGTLNVADNGRGMTELAFLESWMRIGTTDKLRRTHSEEYHRPLTGSKGVGRFAVRRLGTWLNLDSVALDPETKQHVRTRAGFDWKEFSAGKELSGIRIPYHVDSQAAGPTGTRLSISNLSDNWTSSGLERVTSQVLSVISPPLPSWLKKRTPVQKGDPGLSMFFGEPGGGKKLEPASSDIIDRWVARMTFETSKSSVTFHGVYRDTKSWKPREQRVWTVSLPEGANLIGEVLGEILYFPRRAGVLSGLKSVGRKQAYEFLTAHAGVSVVDRGIRMLPYGSPEDDWLYLSGRHATNLRGWESAVTEALFPADDLESEGRYSPFLRVPANHQVLGWVCIESSREVSKDGPERLMPAMNRRGLIQNSAYKQLRSVVIAGAELIGVIDAEQVREIDEESAKAHIKSVQRSLDRAKSKVRASSTLPPREKSDIISALDYVASQVTRSEAARTRSVEAAESASLLGVLAGFMTHETKTLMLTLRDALRGLEVLERSGRADGIGNARAAVENSMDRLRAFIDYSKSFINRLPEPNPEAFSPRRSVNHVIALFEEIAKERQIQTEVAIPETLSCPKVAEVLYSGVVLNLYTNALKALFRTAESRRRVVKVSASNVGNTHILRVSDTGIGVVEEVADFIFDPFISTTRNQPGPIEGGSGLGLYIVRRSLVAVGGKVSLSTAEPDFTTTFEVSLPRSIK